MLPPPPPSEYESAHSGQSSAKPRLWRIALLAVLLSVISGFIGGVIATQLDETTAATDEPYTQVTSAPVVSDAEASDATSVALVAQRLANSVVTISAQVSGA
ncbi:MAG: hypothetical protein EBV17_00565, partial [Actinobacteria bacterium]|nr:hypothetical protein [Actinomycetota bacterium]